MLYNNKSLKFSNLIVLFFFLFFFSFYSSLKAKQINDFYKDNFWVHGWGDVLPYHIGLSDFAYVDMDIPGKTNLDFNVGLITGAKITKRLGVFTEGRYQRYWDIKNFEVKMGINYSIF